MRPPCKRKSGGGGIRTHERLATPTVFETAPFNRSGTPPGTQSGADFTVARPRRVAAVIRGLEQAAFRADAAGVQSGEQTRLGRFFDRHPLLLRSPAIGALLWGVGYLTWRIGWSGEGASPVAFAMLLATEVYGLWALGTLAWFSWSRPPVARPPATPGRSVDVYVCTYDEPAEVLAATLAGCRALTYSHTTYLLDTEIDPASHVRLMEWCYVVCSHCRLRGRQPAELIPEADSIVVPLPAPIARAAAA
jgi:hypothetical protein